jgi:hypothetical protein
MTRKLNEDDLYKEYEEDIKKQSHLKTTHAKRVAIALVWMFGYFPTSKATVLYEEGRCDVLQCWIGEQKETPYWVQCIGVLEAAEAMVFAIPEGDPFYKTQEFV